MDLTVTQRIRLGIMLGEQRGNVALVRQCARLMDTIELSDEEREACKLRPLPNGLAWDEDSSVGAVQYEFSAEDRDLIKRVVEAGPLQPSDLKWANPLLANL